MTDAELASRWAQAQLAYRGKIRTAAYNSAYVSTQHDVDDMEQELWIVLWDTCRRYDPDRGATFNAFFWTRAKQRIGMIKDWSNALMRSAPLVSLEDEAVSSEVERVIRGTSAEDEALLYELAYHTVSDRVRYRAPSAVLA